MCIRDRAIIGHVPEAPIRPRVQRRPGKTKQSTFRYYVSKAHLSLIVFHPIISLTWLYIFLYFIRLYFTSLCVLLLPDYFSFPTYWLYLQDESSYWMAFTHLVKFMTKCFPHFLLAQVTPIFLIKVTLSKNFGLSSSLQVSRKEYPVRLNNHSFSCLVLPISNLKFSRNGSGVGQSCTCLLYTSRCV